MQTVCTRLPEPYWSRVLDYRTELAKDPLLAALFDPPTAHLSHVLCEDLDWEGLEPALAEFAKHQKAFELRSSGLICFTGEAAFIVIRVLKDDHLAEYHEALYEATSKFAIEPDFHYQPHRWTPHVTIKRCGPHAEAFGAAMAKLARESFTWTMPIEHVSAQYDGGGSGERYERLRFPLTG